MTQCVERRSTETSSMIDKTKEASVSLCFSAIQITEKECVESDDEIDNETSFSSMNVSSVNQDDELMDGITFIPPTPPNERENDPSYEDTMQPKCSLSEIEEIQKQGLCNKKVDSSLTPASFEIDLKSLAGQTMEHNQSEIEIVEPELISDSPNESIDASMTPAAVEIARESLAGQTMEQSQAKIEIVEPELISDSPNESIDASITPAAVEMYVWNADCFIVAHWSLIMI
ncbi:uncharacterized protein LOC126572188 [Anopheles aquasalis]|uniref:uncharacterized protein LOC126572188 n=1 Tax=Anopheles aquasalis TaxID=42839 RepID=UPI00215AF707|nr:uncharacterized protein LOC126572188 [Anopheles aquasalis]